MKKGEMNKLRELVDILKNDDSENTSLIDAAGYLSDILDSFEIEGKEETHCSKCAHTAVGRAKLYGIKPNEDDDYDDTYIYICTRNRSRVEPLEMAKKNCLHFVQREQKETKKTPRWKFWRKVV